MIKWELARHQETEQLGLQNRLSRQADRKDLEKGWTSFYKAGSQGDRDRVGPGVCRSPSRGSYLSLWRENWGPLGDHCKFKLAIRTRQICLISGGVRIASGHWVGDGMRPAFRFRPRPRVWRPPFSCFEYTSYWILKRIYSSQKGRGGTFQPLLSLDDKTVAHCIFGQSFLACLLASLTSILS